MRNKIKESNNPLKDMADNAERINKRKRKMLGSFVTLGNKKRNSENSTHQVSGNPAINAAMFNRFMGQPATAPNFTVGESNASEGDGVGEPVAGADVSSGVGSMGASVGAGVGEAWEKGLLDKESGLTMLEAIYALHNID